MSPRFLSRCLILLLLWQVAGGCWMHQWQHVEATESHGSHTHCPRSQDSDAACPHGPPESCLEHDECTYVRQEDSASVDPLMAGLGPAALELLLVELDRGAGTQADASASVGPESLPRYLALRVLRL